MSLLFNADLCVRDFGAAAVNVDELKHWAKRRGIRIPIASALLDKYEAVQLEAFLCGIQSSIPEMSDDAVLSLAAESPVQPVEEKLKALIRRSPDTARWFLGGQAHVRWRQYLEAGIREGEIKPFDAITGLPIEAPAVVPATPQAIQRPSAKRRASTLQAVLDLARTRALDPSDWTAAWNALVALAQQPDRPAPLLGYTDGEGVKWQADDDVQSVRYLTREAYRRRWERANKADSK